MFSLFKKRKISTPYGEATIRGGICSILLWRFRGTMIEANWKEGHSLIFDDTHTHFAWNHSTEDRAVLFIDFVRPLEGRLGTINEKTITAMQSTLMDNADVCWEAWEAKFGAQLDAALKQR